MHDVDYSENNATVRISSRRLYRTLLQQVRWKGSARYLLGFTAYGGALRRARKAHSKRHRKDRPTFRRLLQVLDHFDNGVVGTIGAFFHLAMYFPVIPSQIKRFSRQRRPELDSFETCQPRGILAKI
ncbi:MAG: hypothetical protein ACI9GW_002061 [Halieaceae bacterium]|jgi:hypothetical protein